MCNILHFIYNIAFIPYIALLHRESNGKRPSAKFIRRTILLTQLLTIALDEEQIAMLIIVEIRTLCIEEPLQTIIVMRSRHILLQKADFSHITIT
jgi:hypothetical protein